MKFYHGLLSLIILVTTNVCMNAQTLETFIDSLGEVDIDCELLIVGTSTFDAATGNKIKTLIPGEVYTFGEVAIRGRIAAIGSPNSGLYTLSGGVSMYDTETGKYISSIYSKTPEIREFFGWHLDSTRTTIIVSATPIAEKEIEKRRIELFDLATGNHLLNLVADDPNVRWFGDSLKIYGNTVLVGSDYETTNGGGGLGVTGSVFVFEASTGKLMRRITPPVSSTPAFGGSVAISGQVALIADQSAGEDLPDDRPGSYFVGNGRVHVYDLRTGDLLHTLKPENAVDWKGGDGPFGVHFGYKVEISGTTALISAPSDSEGGQERGAVFLFDITTGQQIAKIKASKDTYAYGQYISMDGKYALVSPSSNIIPNDRSFLYDLSEISPLLPMNDGNLAARIQGVLGLQHPLTSADIVSLKILDASDSEISDLGSLEHASKLVYLDIRNSNVTGSKLTFDILNCLNLEILWADFARPAEITMPRNFTEFRFRKADGGWVYLTIDIAYAKILNVPEESMDFQDIDNIRMLGQIQDYGIEVNVPRDSPPVAKVADCVVYDEDGDGFLDVTLDGSYSYDISGTITAYSWTFSGAVPNANGIAPTVTLPVGTTLCRLRVTDNHGTSSSPASFTITVRPRLVPVRMRKLFASDAAAESYFGESVAIDGRNMLVGASGDSEHGIDSGGAYLIDMYTGEELHHFVPDDGAAGDFFGLSVAISANHALIGAPGDNDQGPGSGSAYLYDIVSGELLHKFTPNDISADARFGWAVAIFADIAVVGMPDDDNYNADSGSVHIFDVVTGNRLARLTPEQIPTNDELQFGSSLAIHRNNLLIGAPGLIVKGGVCGAAYLFDIKTGKEISKFVVQSGDDFDEQFGTSVALSDTTALIGAPNGQNSGIASGCAYLFDLATGNQIKRLSPLNGADFDFFGYAVDISESIAVVGAPYEDDNGEDSGSAYIFDVKTGRQLHKLTSQDGSTNDAYGFKLSIDGSRCLIGSLGDGDNGSFSGSAYLYDLGGRFDYTTIWNGSDVPVSLRAPDNDANGDNIANLLVYALGKNPADTISTFNQESLPTSMPVTFGTPRATRLILPFDAPDDVTYCIEASIGLNTNSWTEISRKTGDGPWVGTATVTELSNGMGSTVTHFNYPGPFDTSPRSFTRLRVLLSGN